MFTLSALGDEISPDPEEQVRILGQCGLAFIELRAAASKTIADLSELQIRELKSILDREKIGVSAIASPVGKSFIDQPFAGEKARFAHCLELCRVFGAPNIRVFSFYLPEDGDWDNWRRDVLDRLWEMIALAQKAGVRVLHENECAVYGDTAERVKDLMETVLEQVPEGSFAAIHDPANFVVVGEDPWQAWQVLRPWTAHVHVKDWRKGEERACLPGEGHGRLEETLADAAAHNFDGFLTLEPHLKVAGKAGGFTGKELFSQAVIALRGILDRIGTSYR